VSALPAREDSAAAGAFTPSAEVQQFLTELAREHLPDKYEKSKDWGQTTRVLAGWEVTRRGLRLETRRRYREVNDGAWQKYRIEVIDPERTFQVRVSNLRQVDNKLLGEVEVLARLRAFGRHSQWERGVQLYSVSADATAGVRLSAQVEVGVQLDPSRLPPDVVLRPRVTSARLELLDFRLERVSDLSGPVVRSLSGTVEKLVEERIAQKREKLVEKLNRSLAKREEVMRFSAVDFAKARGVHWATRDR
jgi:hypothetical protein